MYFKKSDKLIKTIVFFFIILFLARPLQASEDAGTRKNALKITFLSLVTGSVKLTYEMVTFPQQSAELTLGVIGIGFDSFQVNPKGGLLRAAYKFNLWQPSQSALSGFYVKPEYAWSFFEYDSKDAGRKHSSMHTIMGCFGYQHEINRLVLDVFAGAGAGWGDKVEFQYHHGFMERFGWLTLTFGLKVGFSF